MCDVTQDEYDEWREKHWMHWREVRFMEPHEKTAILRERGSVEA